MLLSPFYKIYDGHDTSCPLLASYTGGSHPAPVTSSGNKASLIFHTDDTILNNGYKGTYEEGRLKSNI